MSQVLVVDDDEDSADTLAESLQDRGFDARVVHDAAEALVMLDEFRADVAIIDLGLPDVDGFELARRMRALPAMREVRLVAVTGFSSRETRDRVRAAGFDDHLVKPVRLDDLEDVIERLIVG
jgi:DNA-binding response OmpR family regulator